MATARRGICPDRPGSRRTRNPLLPPGTPRINSGALGGPSEGRTSASGPFVAVRPLYAPCTPACCRDQTCPLAQNTPSAPSLQGPAHPSPAKPCLMRLRSPLCSWRSPPALPRRLFRVPPSGQDCVCFVSAPLVFHTQKALDIGDVLCVGRLAVGRK